MILRNFIPGFRSGSTKNKIVAIIYYTFAGSLFFLGKPLLALSTLSYPFILFYIIDFENKEPSFFKILILTILILITEISWSFFNF